MKMSAGRAAGVRRRRRNGNIIQTLGDQRSLGDRWGCKTSTYGEGPVNFGAESFTTLRELPLPLLPWSVCFDCGRPPLVVCYLGRMPLARYLLTSAPKTAAPEATEAACDIA